MNYAIKVFYLPILSSLISMFPSVAYSNEETSLLLVCKNKIYITHDSKRNGVSYEGPYDDSRVIELKSHVFKENDHESVLWTLTKDNIEMITGISKNTEQSGKPWWNHLLTVDDKAISYIQRGGNDFDNTKSDDPGMNQKHEYDSELKINRVTGEFKDENFMKTYWKDGTWLSDSYMEIGNCEKASAKF